MSPSKVPPPPEEATQPGLSVTTATTSWTWWSRYLTNVVEQHDAQLDEHEDTLKGHSGRIRVLEDWHKDANKKNDRWDNRLWAVVLILVTVLVTWVWGKVTAPSMPNLTDQQREQVFEQEFQKHEFWRVDPNNPQSQPTPLKPKQ